MDNDTLFYQWSAEFYDKYADEESVANLDFESIAIGFFVAKGLTLDESLKMYQRCIQLGKF